MPLHLAAFKGHPSVVRLLIASAPASVMAHDAEGNSALHLAAAQVWPAPVVPPGPMPLQAKANCFHALS
jgi:hypothetical protein